MTDTGTPGGRGKRPARRRWARLFAGFAVLVAALMFLLQSELVARVAARAIEQVVEAATGEDLTIGRVVVGYWPPKIEIQGIVMTHPATGETIAAVGALRVEPGHEGFRPVLKRIVVEGPQVVLHLDEDGLREFREIPAPPPGAPRPKVPRMIDLVISGGAFRLEAPQGGVDVSGISTRPGAVPGTTDLSIGVLSVTGGPIEQHAQHIELPGITLSPDGISVPKLDVRFEALSIDGGFVLTDRGALGGDLSLHVDLGRLTGTADPAQAYVDGRIDLDASLGGNLEVPVLAGAVVSDGVVIWRIGPTGNLLATRIGDAAGPWRLVPGEPDAVTVGPLRVDWAEGTIGVEATVIPATGAIAGVVTAEGIHLARLLQSVGVAPTPWVDLTADLEAHVTGSVAPFRLDGPFEINVSDFYVDSGPIDAASDLMLGIRAGTVVGQLEVDVGHLVLDGRVSSGRSRGHARADIGFAAYGPLGVDVDFPALDLSVLDPLGDAELGGMAAVHGWVGGRYDVPMTAEATLDVKDAVVLGLPIADRLTARLESDLVRLDFHDIRATLGDTAYQGEFELAFTDPMFIDTQIYTSGGHIDDLAGIFVDVGPMDGLVSGTAVLSGEPYHLEGDITLGLRDVDLYGERFPRGTVSAWMDDGELTLESLQLERGAETVLARGSVKRGFRMNVEVLSDGITLEGLQHLTPYGLPLLGDLSVDAVVGGTLFDPAPRGRLAVTGTYYAKTRLADSVISFETDDGVLAWKGGVLGEALYTRGTLALWDDQPYEAEARFAGFPLHLFYPRGQDGSPIEARISGDVSLAGRFGDDPTPVDIEGRLHEVVASWDGHVLAAPEPWVFAVRGKTLQVPELRLEGNDGSTLGFHGYTLGRGQAAFGGGGTVNLDLARAFVPELEIAQGTADLTVVIEQDTEGSPHVTIGAKVADATLRTGYFPADFEGLSATVEATADRYVIRDVTAEVGGGSFISTESRIDADGWTPRSYQLEGRLDDARIQYLDYLPPMVGDARLRFDGPVDDLLLSGDIEIAEMEFRERIDWEAMVLSLREERLTGSAPEVGGRYFSMDLKVSADDTIRLRNNVADAEASADLRIVGDTARPGMVGEIVLEPGGQVYLHEREFDLTRGEVRYVDPYTFDPDLDILLETDVRSHEHDYHVTYGVSGLFSDWRTNTASDPYLAQADVNALLLFGVTREELERYGGLGTALVAETSDLLLAQTAISRANLFIIDRWNLVSGVSERGSSSVTSDLRLVAEKQVGEFDITVEKRLGVNLGSDWYASVERRIAEKLYATAYIATRQEGRSLPIGAAYGAEFKFKWELD